MSEHIGSVHFSRIPNVPGSVKILSLAAHLIRPFRLDAYFDVRL